MQKHFSNTTLRPLGALEHLLWLVDQVRPMHIVFAAEITGTASNEDWRKALDRAQERHPLLSMRIEGGPGSPPRFCAVPGTPIPLRVVEADPKSQWEAEVYREFVTPFDPNVAPLMRAALIQGSGRCALILAAHHAINDGMGMTFLIRDILEALNGKALEPLPLAPSMDALFGFEETLPAAPAPEWDRDAMLGRRLPPWPQMQTFRLDPSLTGALKHRAKQEKATVHAALMSAIAVAGARLSHWQKNPVRALSPVNVRQALGLSEDVGGVYAIGAASELDPVKAARDASGFWEVAREASLSLAARRNRETSVPVVAALRQFTSAVPDVDDALGFAANVMARDFLVTNHGELPIPTRYGDLELEAVWPSILASFGQGEHVFIVATMKGVLCVAYAAEKPLPGLLPGIRDTLQAAVA
jgi:hypothetical protein